MINHKKLISIVKKWQKLAAIGRRRISLQKLNSGLDTEKCSKSTVEKGHLVVYNIDKKRFVMPLCYLNNNIIKELFNMAKDEFGLEIGGPITLSCDAVFMVYIVSLIQRRVSEDMKKALLVSMGSGRCSESFLQEEQINNQLLIQGF